MLISYNWLQTYFENPLPSPEVLADKLTFYAWEIDEIIPKLELGDTVLDVKVLPDKSSWALSHRGVAREISAVLGIPMKSDPLDSPAVEIEKSDILSVSLDISKCTRYALARIDGVAVKPSPEWLVQHLTAIGQRSINNIIDATNYVLFGLGTPTHVFDADKISNNSITVRQATEDEKITVLGEQTLTLSSDDVVIADGKTNIPLAIGGVKGGVHAQLTEETKNILIEVAHFDAVSTRKTAQRTKIRTDASTRYENGMVAGMVPYALEEVVRLIIDIAGGTYIGATEVNRSRTDSVDVTCTLAKLNSVGGLSLSLSEVEQVLKRAGFVYSISDYNFTVTPSFERTDLRIAEDIIEEIVRLYGLEHVEAILPPLSEGIVVDKHFVYREKIRTALVEAGFSEILTSSFRDKDEVKLQNALASDKGYLRSSLRENMQEALAKNAPNTDLLGLSEIRIFEIGNVFSLDEEISMVALGVCGISGYKPKQHDPILKEAVQALETVLGVNIPFENKNGVVEFSLDTLLPSLALPVEYMPVHTHDTTKAFVPFSLYPSISRDIALWVPEGTDPSSIETLLTENAGELCVRTTLVDTFAKDGRTSYAFRLVFQSPDRTLENEEVQAITDSLYSAVTTAGWEAR